MDRQQQQAQARAEWIIRVQYDRWVNARKDLRRLKQAAAQAKGSFDRTEAEEEVQRAVDRANPERFMDAAAQKIEAVYDNLGSADLALYVDEVWQRLHEDAAMKALGVGKEKTVADLQRSAPVADSAPIPGLLDWGKPFVIAGPPGPLTLGTALDLCGSLALQEPVLGQRPVSPAPQGRPVLYYGPADQETTVAALWEQVAQARGWTRADGRPFDTVNLRFRFGKLNLTDPRTCKVVLPALLRGVDVLVVDFAALVLGAKPSLHAKYMRDLVQTCGEDHALVLVEQRKKRPVKGRVMGLYDLENPALRDLAQGWMLVTEQALAIGDPTRKDQVYRLDQASSLPALACEAPALEYATVTTRQSPSARLLEALPWPEWISERQAGIRAGITTWSTLKAAFRDLGTQVEHSPGGKVRRRQLALDYNPDVTGSMG